MTVTCNYRSTAVIILPGVYLPPQRNATVADDAFSLLFISIHAPREGSDVQYCPPVNQAGGFQSTLPARGATLRGMCVLRNGFLFQSTLPARGATVFVRYIRFQLPNFNPRSPRGERRLPPSSKTKNGVISIHAPREGSDSFSSFSSLWL